MEISQASTKGVFDFNTEEIMARYSAFLQVPKPQADADTFPNDEEVVISPKESHSPEGKTGDPKVDPKEKVPDTDENGEGLGRSAKTLDQWLNQIITHPEAPSLNEVEEAEDRTFNSANFWKEEKLPSKDVIDLILQEMGL